MQKNKLVIERIIEYGAQYPDKLAIADSGDDNGLTYGEFVKKIRQCGKSLLDKGIAKGDRVMICGLCRKEYVIGYFAIHLIGAIAVPYEKHIEQEKFSYIIKHVNAKLVLTDVEVKEVDSLNLFDACTNEAWYQGDAAATEDAIADILFTTGTTGLPKGVVMTHKNIYYGAENVACGVEMQPEDVDMVVAPMNHAYAMGCLRAVMITGAAIVLHESCTLLKDMLHKLKQYNCTGFSSVPATIKMLYEYTRGSIEKVLGGVRYIELGSSSLDVHMKKELLEKLPNTSFYLNYGSTEAPRNIYMDLKKTPDKAESIGKAAVHATIYIMDEAGNELEPGKEHVGRLVIEGDMVMPCYWNDKEGSDVVLDGNRFWTNDIGCMDADGFVYLMGRKNDLLNIGGELMSPLEIEAVANQYNHVEMSACISVKDAESVLGEKIVLFVQMSDQDKFHEEEMMDYLKQHLEAKKMPHKIAWIKKLPTNYVGKLDRKKLAAFLSNGILF